MRHQSGSDIGGTIMAWIFGLMALWVVIGLIPDLIVVEINMIIHFFTGVHGAI